VKKRLYYTKAIATMLAELPGLANLKLTTNPSAFFI
jgi:hypothetical protein